MTSVEFIRPNLHVALVHFPIALLAAGTAIEVFSFLGWRRSGFRSAGRWMILLGALLSPGVALSGVYAMRDAIAAPADHEQFASWNEMLAHSRLASDEPAWTTLRRHLWLQVVASAAAMLVVLGWLALSDGWRRRLHFGFVSLLLATVAVTLIGAHSGGRLVYDHAVGVALPTPPPVGADVVVPPAVDTTPDTFSPPAPPSTPVQLATPVQPATPVAAPTATTAPTTTQASNLPATQATSSSSSLPVSPPPAAPPAARTAIPSPQPAPPPQPAVPPAAAVTRPAVDADAILEVADQLAVYLPPLQTHMVLAGLSISLSLLAVALSIRRWSDVVPLEIPGDPPTTRSQRRIAAAFSQPAEVDPDIDAPWPPGIVTHPKPTVPSARFFLLACLLATITAAAGAWYLAGETREVQPRQLWEQVVAPYQNMDANGQPVIPTRRLAHVVAGAALILLPLLLAVVARLAPRSRLLLLGLATLLLVTVVAQLWFGTLLLLDSNVGSITAFQGD